VPERAPFEAATAVAIGDLLSDYKANELRADGKWKGKRIHTSGTVTQVGKGLRGEAFVTLGTGARLEIPSAQCFLADPADDEALALSAGGKAVVEGRVERLLGHVMIRECVVNPMAHLCKRLIAAVGGVECSRYSPHPSGDATAAIFEDNAKHDDGFMGVLECIQNEDPGRSVLTDARERYDGMMALFAKDPKEVVVGSSRVYCFTNLIATRKGRAFPPELRAKIKDFYDAL